jgi:hypothetical protein
VGHADPADELGDFVVGEVEAPAQGGGQRELGAAEVGLREPDTGGAEGRRGRRGVGPTAGIEEDAFGLWAARQRHEAVLFTAIPTGFAPLEDQASEAAGYTTGSGRLEPGGAVGNGGA